MDKVQVFNVAVSLGSPPCYLDLEKQINDFLCTNINAQVVQILELNHGGFLLVFRTSSQMFMTPDKPAVGQEQLISDRLSLNRERAIAVAERSGQKPPVIYPSREQQMTFIRPPVVEPEQPVVESKPRFLDCMPLVSAKKRDRSTVLCQAGVFGVPPGTRLLAGDPPVPPPLISSDCDLAEWADLFSGVEKKELPDAGSKTGRSKRVPLRNSP